MNLQDIKILETDFKFKYLVTSSDNTVFYCGVIMKDVLNSIKTGMTTSEIVDFINSKHKTEYDAIQIDTCRNVIQNKATINKSSFKPLIFLFNSEKMPIQKFSVLTNQYFFFSSFFVLLIINLFFVNSIEYTQLDGFEKLFKYTILFIILIMHEIGHSAIAKQYNIKTGKVGLGIYLFIPVFYINLNEIWRLKKEKRVLINLGGIYFQFISSIILITLYIISKSDIIGSLIKVNFIIAMINFNPFIKFDGYWVLADLINDKDLYSHSNKAIKSWLRLKFHQYSNIVTYYSIGRIAFWIYVIYISCVSTIKFLATLWN
ncbi:MAG: M50 family metallopeptidase [Candidatus Margulisbacteria bacterium]|jgi:Zn-dependent protease|nr:M50 family metallopeptidase [Bacteroidales bacterium]MDD4528034.1 M50 family metallopeptidase [Candidatus Margulisiibacteriota bacterium]MDY0198548.1 M50 family metallopeptidase [Tenuifilaceae bacterium]